MSKHRSGQVCDMGAEPRQCPLLSAVVPLWGFSKKEVQTCHTLHLRPKREKRGAGRPPTVSHWVLKDRRVAEVWGVTGHCSVGYGTKVTRFLSWNLLMGAVFGSFWCIVHTWYRCARLIFSHYINKNKNAKCFDIVKPIKTISLCDFSLCL